jgi:hypothetical protein
MERQPSFTFRAEPERRDGEPGFRVEVMTPDLQAVQSHWIDARAWMRLQEQWIHHRFSKLVAAGASIETAVDKALGLPAVVSLAVKTARKFDFVPVGAWAEESVREASRVLNTPLSDQLVRRAARILAERVTRPIPADPA